MIVTDPVLIELLNNHVVNEVAICAKQVHDPENYEYPYISEWHQGETVFEGKLSILFKLSNKVITWRSILVFKENGRTERS